MPLLAALLLLGCGEAQQSPEAQAGHQAAASQNGHSGQHQDATQAAEAGATAASGSGEPHEGKGAGLEITNAYVRQPAPGQPVAAAFLSLSNTSDKAYTLNHVSSSRAGAVAVHRTLYEEGMMTMRHVHHLVIAPRSELIFEPGGYHLMLTDLDAQLEPGDVVPLRLEFESGMTLTLDAEVKPLR